MVGEGGRKKKRKLSHQNDAFLRSSSSRTAVCLETYVRHKCIAYVDLFFNKLPFKYGSIATTI